MKKLYLTLTVILILIFRLSNLNAQKPKPDKTAKPNKEAQKEKINELRKKFYNEKLALSEVEQKSFWPIFDEFNKKKKNLLDSFQKKYKPNKLTFMDDKQAEEFLNAQIKLKEDQLNLHKEYTAKFKKVISVKKVAMLEQTEREFKKTLLQKLKENKGPAKPEEE